MTNRYEVIPNQEGLWLRNALLRSKLPIQSKMVSDVNDKKYILNLRGLVSFYNFILLYTGQDWISFRCTNSAN